VNSAELSLAIRNGDRAAEALLVERYGPAIRRFLGRRVFSPTAVDDLFQDSFVVAISRLRDGRVRAADRLGCFMIGIARRLVLSYLRRKAKPRTLVRSPDGLLSDDTSPEQAAEREIVRGLVGARLRGMELARDREALVRRYLLEEDTGTIARELGVSPGEVRVVLCRARRRLRSACADLAR
jgi:RNA polymerase sigma factor (sigma-70 family)